MSLLYEQYLHHFQSGQQALSIGREPEARREFMLASRCILRLAEESNDAEMRAARKQKGLRLLEMAQRLPKEERGQTRRSPRADRSSGTRPDHSAADVSNFTGEPERTDGKRWEVVDKPGIYFKDIAGLDEAKDLIRRRVIYPFLNPELAAKYRRQPGGGVLLYGPPGTGKTMLAKAIATELDAPFYNVLCSDVMSKWVGEAEQNLKELFDAARSHLPSVIFLDETEALIAKRGGHSTVMNRLIPEFLAQVDGLATEKSGLLLLGATNRPWDLDPAALRHGRFGEHVYVGLPDKPARRFILEWTLSTVPAEPDVNLDQIAERSEGLSGADLNGLVERIIDPAFESAMATGQAAAVTWDHVERALKTTVPSVSRKELDRYEKFSKTRE